jgi:hypothetical protein
MRITKCLLKQSTIWGAPADHAGILDVNPAASVRGPRYVVKRGKTPVLSHLHAETQSVFSEKERRSETQPRSTSQYVDIAQSNLPSSDICNAAQIRLEMIFRDIGYQAESFKFIPRHRQTRLMAAIPARRQAKSRT